MKHYTININNSKKNTGINFRTINNPSKSLDDLILTNMIKMNPYLDKTDNTLDAMFEEAGFGKDEKIYIINRDDSYLLKDDFDTEFIKAADFLSKYTPTKKIYKFYDGTPIEFFEDEIQIGNILIPLYNIRTRRYDSYDADTKKIIINLYLSIIR